MEVSCELSSRYRVGRSDWASPVDLSIQERSNYPDWLRKNDQSCKVQKLLVPTIGRQITLVIVYRAVEHAERHRTTHST